MMEKKDYLLTYGFRRYAACKKLGWAKIPCYLKDKDEIINLSFDEIVVPDGNTRIEHNDEAMIQLLTSIKQHGLLEPIGVAKAEEVTEKDFVIRNFIENFHRLNPKPFDQAQAIRRMKNFDLNNGEIAAILSIPKTRIETLLHLLANTFNALKEAENIPAGGGKSKKGKLSYSVLKTIALARLTKAQIKGLSEVAREEEYSSDDIRIIIDLLRHDMPLKTAIKNRHDFRRVHPTIIIDMKKLKSAGYEKKEVGKLINGMLKGLIPMNSELFYFERSLKDFKK